MKLTIKAGKHYHSNWIAKLFILNLRKSLKYYVRFENECWYPAEIVVHSGKNKLFGFGSLDHHKNSARFAWQPATDKEVINIYSYVYRDSILNIKYLKTVKTCESNEFEITVSEDGYEFYINNDSGWVIDWDGKKPHWKKLQFYFGGKDNAYWDMVCHFKK